VRPWLKCLVSSAVVLVVVACSPYGQEEARAIPPADSGADAAPAPIYDAGTTCAAEDPVGLVFCEDFHAGLAAWRPDQVDPESHCDAEASTEKLECTVVLAKGDDASMVRSVGALERFQVRVTFAPADATQIKGAAMLRVNYPDGAVVLTASGAVRAIDDTVDNEPAFAVPPTQQMPSGTVLFRLDLALRQGELVRNDGSVTTFPLGSTAPGNVTVGIGPRDVVPATTTATISVVYDDIVVRQWPR